MWHNLPSGRATPWFRYGVPRSPLRTRTLPTFPNAIRPRNTHGTPESDGEPPRSRAPAPAPRTRASRAPAPRGRGAEARLGEGPGAGGDVRRDVALWLRNSDDSGTQGL
ncbi:hypothetical protein JCM4814A_73570 [Streptomyces phaeofaciens JCM 4814]|uniref:Uncharacterized protein n=1 Tax=Streptomyces phaeofaciens TaxID=68254 RepID=A0A918HH87_9ACTN|nr:hypothetical protein GCM10010226_46030 [Streptomyces phaeofaciens]